MKKSLFAVVALVLTGCASAPPISDTADLVEEDPVAAAVVYPGPGYKTPEAMLAKLIKAGLPFHDCSPYGSMFTFEQALEVYCFGDHEEQIYLDVFETEAIGDASTAAAAAFPRAVFRGKNWSVSSTTKATAARAGKVLTKK